MRKLASQVAGNNKGEHGMGDQYSRRFKDGGSRYMTRAFIEDGFVIIQQTERSDKPKREMSDKWYPYTKYLNSETGVTAYLLPERSGGLTGYPYTVCFIGRTGKPFRK